MNVVVDNLLTNYTLAGKGKLVLLLHGWGDSSKGLADLQKHLSERYKVLAMDLPGFGGTQAPSAVWDLDDYAGFVAATLKKLRLDRPYAVIGHSNGGALAIRGVGTGMLKPDRLVLLAASGVRTGGGTRRLLLKIVAKVGKVATFWLPERYRKALRKRLYGVAGSDMLVAPHLQETFKRTVRQDVQADAARVEIPTLLIYGSEDRAVPPEHGRRYHGLIKGSRLEFVDGAGHFAHIEQPDKIVGLIEGFLK